MQRNGCAFGLVFTNVLITSPYAGSYDSISSQDTMRVYELQEDDCPPKPGACCDSNTGECMPVNDESECWDTFIEDGVCTPNPCPQPPTGKCLYNWGSGEECVDNVTESMCYGAYGGYSWTQGETCPTPTPSP
jgi:hypothetical protein